MSDIFYTGILPQSNFRFTVIDCSEICSHLFRIHNLDDRMINFLSKTLMGAFFLARMVKGEQRISIQWKDESKQSVLAYSNRLGMMKGTAYSGELEAGDIRNDFIHGSGILKVIRWKLEGDPYSSFTNLVVDTFEENFRRYIEESEQVLSICLMNVSIPRDGFVVAKGIFFQALPEADEDSRNRIIALASSKLDRDSFFAQENTELVASLSSLLEEEVELLDSGQPMMQCDCSRNKIAQVIVSLGEKEANEIITEQGKIEVECEFCKSRYDFEREHVARLFPD